MLDPTRWYHHLPPSVRHRNLPDGFPQNELTMASPGTNVTTMQIRAGYELIYDCPQPTPMVLMLNIHHTRAGDIVVPDRMIDGPGRPDDGLPGRLRQLVHADRRAGGPAAADRQFGC